MTDSERKTEVSLSQVDTDYTSPSSSPHFSRSLSQSTPPPVVGGVSITADPQVQAALAELRRQQDEEKADQRSFMTQLLEGQQQLMNRLLVLETRPTPSSVSLSSAPLFPASTQLPTSNPLGINPALLATPATVRLAQPSLGTAAPTHLPHPSVVRGLFPTSTNGIQPPPRPYNDEEKGWDKWVQDAKKTIKIEPFKGGTQDERRSIRTWVTSLSMQLDLIAGPRAADGSVNSDRQQQEQARVATTYLQDSALDWALMYQIQCKATSQPVRWDQMSFALMAKYEGQDHGLLRRQELQTLTYKRGRCTDLPKYEAEFDRLALLVHGSEMQHPAVDALLGQLFASGIQRGDERLYESMLPVGSSMPESLQQWKARAESAIVRAQALKIGSTNSRPSAVVQATLHNTEANEEHQSVAVEQRSHPPSSQPLVDVAELVKLLAIMQTHKPRSKQQSQFGRGTSSRKYQLTKDERDKLFAVRRCFCCYKVGHTARECSQKATLPIRAPSAEELKA